MEHAAANLKRRAAVAEALSKAAEIFTSHNEEAFDKILTNGIRPIADAAGLDRVAFFRKVGIDDTIRFWQMYQWDKTEGALVFPGDELQILPDIPVISHWISVLSSNNSIKIRESDMTEEEREFFRTLNVKSVLMIPIFYHNELWGVVGLMDLFNDRYFDEDCSDLLHTAARLCANTVIQTEMEGSIATQNKILKVRLEQQKVISEIVKTLISSGNSETLIGEVIAKLGRYYNASQVFIFSIEQKPDGTYPTYFWSNEDSPLLRAKIDLFSWIKDSFPENLPVSFTLPFISCADVSASTTKRFHPLLRIGVRAFICVPLYVDGRLWGTMSVEQRGTPRQWTENEKMFGVMAASTISGVIMRNLYTSMLKDALNKATEASKAKSDFLSNMSHEMRTPLNAIIGMTAIGRKAPSIVRKNYALDMIENASTHLLSVINDVLDMSKIAENKLELSYIEFNFKEMMEKAVAISNFRIEEKNINFSLRIDSAIPHILIGDDQRLTQVITNLLGNAVKFTANNGSIKIDTRFLEEKSGICTIQFLVSDTGIGISEEQQKILFQSFQQAESGTSRKYGGSGLGLSISKSLVEMMKGKIWIESELGKGSTFFFTVKMKRIEEKKKKASSDEAPLPHDETSHINNIFDGYTVLLAEDVEINRDIVLALLEPTRLKIYCAENGVEAVRMFSETPEKYDLIFMDVQMPEMDGHEATRCIRALDTEKSKSIPIIAMTANVFREDVEKCLEVGMNNHVGKPLNIDDVINKLRCYLPKR